MAQLALRVCAKNEKSIARRAIAAALRQIAGRRQGLGDGSWAAATLGLTTDPVSTRHAGPGHRPGHWRTARRGRGWSRLRAELCEKPLALRQPPSARKKGGPPPRGTPNMLGTRSYAGKLGVDIKRMLTPSPHRRKGRWELTDTLVRSGAVGHCGDRLGWRRGPQAANRKAKMGDFLPGLQARL